MKKKLFLFVLLIALSFSMTSCVGSYMVHFALDRDIAATHRSQFNAFTTKESKMNNSQRLVNNRRLGMQKALYYWDASQKDKQKWTQTTNDGLKLVADFYPCENSHRYVILVHGYTGSKESMLHLAPYFSNWDFNVLLPDNRAHGQSEGQWIGMGWLDSVDCLGWINKIIKKDPLAEITMLGVSMGGATVMMLSGLDLPSNVKCLIEDCGYTTVWDEFVHGLDIMFKLEPHPVLDLSDVKAKELVGYGLKEASSLDRLKNAKLPMLFIHGTDDNFVSYDMLDENIASYGGPYSEVLRVEDAEHAMSFYKDPNLYLNTVHDFVFKFIK